ncbi:uncharacterized protein SPPG_05132 [Spizellomyces punctatus DAOM BR117]|uniref:Uncharacterized protein n=1 Tax=Spizellomyces punctatus (strain DAOM BR117) TaxID=645134 RepID=A0A0L0HFQ5_SPIPD|nr:hypothetical protein, variant [Spizellomyces punctatus DAOM BR117]XP_016607794.1 uncharacterized protein SPPG_05132 [Spizellomyces punctatus DAOM BR117]KNC99753.1 hypothetical protein, variant [Spizellomyces punctatus DAOM BR117]KNC99754.1 hypothetical protein SPPG_05132 [Spizellomyces punctatus DAOM BR117]|eukprot:XP_016607793.1 hypothetical protein, variant [Spizellomyces punctatus DAOM BR117]
MRWTNTVSINKVLVNKLRSAKPEDAIGLSVFLSVTYLHELAHWTGAQVHGVDWRLHDGFFSFAKGEPEAGFYLESQVFGGRIAAYGSSKWKIAGLAVEGNNQERRWLALPDTVLLELFYGTYYSSFWLERFPVGMRGFVQVT